eukprot:GDKJ01003273.1.p1 GENE.GDKJ01003273.1~~GDKJ01003273.1.p1  ORF type:complete len:226 (-),score=46.81 GDKJ01003273.1:237-914(-)
MFKLIGSVVSLALLTNAHMSAVPHETDINLCAIAPEDTSRVDDITISSYHVHVLYDRSAPRRAKALQLLDIVEKQFDLPKCPRGGNDHMNFACSFGEDHDPAGPWNSPQWSIFFLPEHYEKISQFVLKHRSDLDVMIHPNSGCGHLDHTHWAVWSGKMWPLVNMFRPEREKVDSFVIDPDRSVEPQRTVRGDTFNPHHWRENPNPPMNPIHSAIENVNDAVAEEI